MNLKTLNVFFILYIFSFGCTEKKKYSPDEIKESHRSKKDSLNTFLIQNDAIESYGGDVWCDHVLLGGNDEKFYIYLTCQEYYISIQNTIVKRSEVKTPAVVIHDNDNILKLNKPRGDFEYEKDMIRLFPSQIVNDLQNMTNNELEVKGRQLDLFLSGLNEKKTRILTAFKEYSKGSKTADFYGGGSEPFWSVFISNNLLLVKWVDQINEYKLLTEFESDKNYQVLKYVNSVSDTLNINITKQSSFEEFSNNFYPYSIELFLNTNFSLKGVGNTKPLE